MPVAKRWAIYALGGGLGHLTRSMALGRAALQAAASRGHCLQIDVLTNSPFAELVCQAVNEPGLRIRPLSAALSQEQTVAAVHAWLHQLDATTLIVDTFPRGLGGELADVISRLDQRKVLVQRDLRPDYACRASVQASVQRFDLVLVPGEQSPWMSDRAVFTAPWLVRDFHELLSAEQAATVLGAAADQSVVAFAGCGTTGEVEEMRGWASASARLLGEQTHVCFLDATGATATNGPDADLTVVQHWPLLELLPGIDVLIAGGGYNCVHEARLTGTTLLGVSRDRLYDDQQRRLHQADVCVVTESSLPAQLRQTLAATRRRTCQPYENGVHAAVARLTDD